MSCTCGRRMPVGRAEARCRWDESRKTQIEAETAELTENRCEQERMCL